MSTPDLVDYIRFLSAYFMEDNVYSAESPSGMTGPKTCEVLVRVRMDKYRGKVIYYGLRLSTGNKKSLGAIRAYMKGERPYVRDWVLHYLSMVAVPWPHYCSDVFFVFVFWSLRESLQESPTQRGRTQAPTGIPLRRLKGLSRFLAFK